MLTFLRITPFIVKTPSNGHYWDGGRLAKFRITAFI